MYVYLTAKLYCLGKIYIKVYYVLYGYCIIVRRNYNRKHFPVRRKWCELRLELIIKTVERCRLRVFLLLTFSK